MHGFACHKKQHIKQKDGMERSITKSKFLEDDADKRHVSKDIPRPYITYKWENFQDLEQDGNSRWSNAFERTQNIDSYTQTSKTVIVLRDTADEQFSPDSLMVTPRDSNLQTVHRHYLDAGQLNEKLQTACRLNNVAPIRYNFLQDSKMSIPSISHQFSLPHSDKEEISPHQKFNPTKSLTKTFLEKKKSSEQQLSATQVNRAQFLQQTSPLRNLKKKQGDNRFKSTSYVEPYKLKQHLMPEENFSNVQRSLSNKFNKDEKSLEKVVSGPLKCKWPSLIPMSNNFVSSESSHKTKKITSDKLLLNLKDKKFAHKREGTFMSPTLSSELRNESSKIEEIKQIIKSNCKRGKSVSPSRTLQQTVPVTVENLKPKHIFSEKNCCKSIQSKSDYVNVDMDHLKLDLSFISSKDSSISENTLEKTTDSSDNLDLSSIVNRIKDEDWSVSLRGLAEMAELSRTMDHEYLHGYMITVNQRLIELMRSPRSHVCRMACQAAGQFFETMKDTRRPEFDDIVEILLYKTADANKFIREDANVSLDCMITNVPISHSVRTLCLKGPMHKNPLVRTATGRLIVCALMIAGPDNVLSLPSNESTRRRIIVHMVKFLEDRNSETRKYGERLYRILDKEPIFEAYLRKYLEKEEIERVKSAMSSRRLGNHHQKSR